MNKSLIILLNVFLYVNVYGNSDTLRKKFMVVMELCDFEGKQYSPCNILDVELIHNYFYRVNNVNDINCRLLNDIDTVFSLNNIFSFDFMDTVTQLRNEYYNITNFISDTNTVCIKSKKLKHNLKKFYKSFFRKKIPDKYKLGIGKLFFAVFYIDIDFYVEQKNVYIPNTKSRSGILRELTNITYCNILKVNSIEPIGVTTVRAIQRCSR